jgi:hypothetical protein
LYRGIACGWLYCGTARSGADRGITCGEPYDGGGMVVRGTVTG